MSVLASSSISAHRSPVARRSIDVFGVRWPLHKAEAVLAALVVFAVGLVLTAITGGTTIAPAVLAAAGSAVAVWWTGRLLHRA